MKKLTIKIIEFYQRHISIHLKARCRFYPTCSEYTKQAIDKYGIMKGIFKGFLRIIKCHPFSNGGVDKLE